MGPLLMQFRPKRFRFPRPGWNFHTLAPATLLLFFLPFQFTGAVRGEGPLVSWFYLFGLSWDGIFGQGHLWQFLTHPFLHGNFSHWLTNAFFLYYFGGRIHDIFGEKEVWRTATWSTLLGGVFHLLAQGDSPLAGASGAGMGLFVALTTVSPESKMFPLPIRARNLRNGVVLSTALLLLMIPSLRIPGFSQLGELLISLGGASLFQIGHGCHLGGALAGGIAMRKYFRKPVTLAQLKRERAEREENSAA